MKPDYRKIFGSNDIPLSLYEALEKAGRFEGINSKLTIFEIGFFEAFRIVTEVVHTERLSKEEAYALFKRIKEQYENPPLA